jgi:hypothetical protein
LEPGARIGPYEIVGLEGEGGIGTPVAVDPMLDVVRSEPLFDALLEKMDLPRN